MVKKYTNMDEVDIKFFPETYKQAHSRKKQRIRGTGYVNQISTSIKEMKKKTM